MTPPRRGTRASSAGLGASRPAGKSAAPGLGAFRSRSKSAAPGLGKPTRPRRIRLLVLDVDGVLTDGRLYYGPRGELMKSFHVRDGHGIKALRAAGVEVAVLTGRRSAAVARRCRELGIRHVIQGVDDKLAAFGQLTARLRMRPVECACIGDDEPDVALMRAVGLAFAVADAHPTALRAAHHTTSVHGGRGAVREVCDRLVGAVRRLERRP